MNKKPEQERRNRVVSFRIDDATQRQLEQWLTALNDPKVKSLDQLSRKVLLDSLPGGLSNGLFKASATPAIPTWDIVCGDAIETLRKIKDGVVDTVVTSPPYYRQKVYGHTLELGREKDPEHYLQRLVSTFRECRRVLKDTGSLWIVIDDTYHRKQLLGIPWRLMLALQADGWIVRGEQIWHKNGMCEGVDDRTTRDHEFVFFLTKKARGYYYDQDGIREPFAGSWAQDCIAKAQAAGVNARPRINPFSKEHRHKNGQTGISRAEYGALMNPLGRNRRSVWAVTTEKLKAAHYAPFPETLVKTCVDAGCPPGGVCLDPFTGSGTTGVYTVKSGRKFLGVEVVPKFAAMARKRIMEAESQAGSTPMKSNGVVTEAVI